MWFQFSCAVSLPSKIKRFVPANGWTTSRRSQLTQRISLHVCSLVSSHWTLWAFVSAPLVFNDGSVISLLCTKLINLLDTSYCPQAFPSFYCRTLARYLRYISLCGEHTCGFGLRPGFCHRGTPVFCQISSGDQKRSCLHHSIVLFQVAEETVAQFWRHVFSPI